MRLRAQRIHERIILQLRHTRVAQAHRGIEPLSAWARSTHCGYIVAYW
jgi:hypothetical protein